MPEVSGAATLVPATVSQPPQAWLKMGMSAATAEVSATVRPGQCGECCQAGLRT